MRLPVTVSRTPVPPPANDPGRPPARRLAWRVCRLGAGSVLVCMSASMLYWPMVFAVSWLFLDPGHLVALPATALVVLLHALLVPGSVLLGRDFAQRVFGPLASDGACRLAAAVTAVGTAATMAGLGVAAVPYAVAVATFAWPLRRRRRDGMAVVAALAVLAAVSAYGVVTGRF